jgi:peptide deformylase
MHVVVRAQDRNGEYFEVEGEGLTARAFCHEIDHLNGILFPDKAERMLTDEELARLRGEGEEDEEFEDELDEIEYDTEEGPAE